MIVEAHAPVRVADCGGWTDTWFAHRGLVCNVAVAPGAEARLSPADERGVTLEVGATGERYTIRPGDHPGRHPLLERAIALVPPDADVVLRVGAAVPPGSGMGTSAAVVVAVLAALHAWRGETLDRAALAAAAHGVETGLGLQSGVQDQQAAAHGGVSVIEVAYPAAHRSAVTVPPAALAALEARLVTVYLGHPHSSSAVHEEVIRSLESCDPEPLLAPLRDAAARAAAALGAGDLGAYGAALLANHAGQVALHAELVGADARSLFALAGTHGAIGWKVNGAGGAGGSATVLLGADEDANARFCAAIDAHPSWRRLPLQLAGTGVTVERR